MIKPQDNRIGAFYAKVIDTRYRGSFTPFIYAVGFDKCKNGKPRVLIYRLRRKMCFERGDRIWKKDIETIKLWNEVLKISDEVFEEYTTFNIKDLENGRNKKC